MPAQSTRKALLSAIKRASVISFDVFDTAIVRNVDRPKDIFIRVEHLYNKRYEKLPFSFVDARIIAEYSAQMQMQIDYNCSDVSLDDIYDQLEYNKYDQHIIDRLKAIEIETELASVLPDRIVKDVYNAAIASGKRVIFVSDMYLSEHVIREMLTRCGYLGKLDVHVSSAYRLSKHNATLLPAVLKKINVDAKDVLHIGDNEHADVKQAAKAGVYTYHYPMRRLGWIDTMTDSADGTILSRSMTAALINHHHKWHGSHDDAAQLNHIGYSYFGPLVLTYCMWFNDIYHAHNYTNIFFMARDGYIIQKVFEMLRDKDVIKPYNGKYVYISRRALRLLDFERELTTEDIEHLIDDKEIYGRTLQNAFNRWGLNIEQHAAVIASFRWTAQTIIEKNDATREQLVRLLSDDRIKTAIVQTAADEKACIVDYFKQLGLADGQKIMMVDLLVSGNLHRGLVTLLKELNDIEAHGYYFATNRRSTKNLKDGYIMNGLYVNEGKPYYRHNCLEGSLSLLEAIISAPHPSLKRFVRDGQTIAPDFVDEQLERGELDKLTSIHQGILDYVQDALNANHPIFEGIYECDMPVELVKRVYTQPTKYEAKLLGSLSHFDFGMVPEMGKPLPIHRYLLNPNAGFSHFKKSYWQQAYLVNLCGEWILSPSVKRALSRFKHLIGE